MTTTEAITKNVTLAYIVPAAQRVKIVELCPLNGKIKSVTIQFPRNCNGLVHVAFGHSDVWVVPSIINSFLSLDDTTWVEPHVEEPVRKNEYLWGEIRNGDGLNPHTITIIANIVGRVD